MGAELRRRDEEHGWEWERVRPRRPRRKEEPLARAGAAVAFYRAVFEKSGEVTLADVAAYREGSIQESEP